MKQFVAYVGIENGKVAVIVHEAIFEKSFNTNFLYIKNGEPSLKHLSMANLFHESRVKDTRLRALECLYEEYCEEAKDLVGQVSELEKTRHLIANKFMEETCKI